MALSLDELLVRDAVLSDDPVERHIIKKLMQLRHQNKRLKAHIQKTGSWAQLKNIDVWKPYDFYHYFCAKYHDHFGTEYRDLGNPVAAYNRIEEFRVSIGATKKEYKTFIDHSFEKYFNKMHMPTVSSICHPSLYRFIMDDGEGFATPEQFHVLDRDLVRANEQYEEYVNAFNASR